MEQELRSLVEPTPLLGLTQVAYEVPDAAALLGLPVKTLYQMLRRGKLFGLRTGAGGRGWRVMARDIEAYYLEQRERWEAKQLKDSLYGGFDS